MIAAGREKGDITDTALSEKRPIRRNLVLGLGNGLFDQAV